MHIESKKVISLCMKKWQNNMVVYPYTFKIKLFPKYLCMHEKGWGNGFAKVCLDESFASLPFFFSAH